MGVAGGAHLLGKDKKNMQMAAGELVFWPGKTNKADGLIMPNLLPSN